MKHDKHKEKKIVYLCDGNFDIFPVVEYKKIKLPNGYFFIEFGIQRFDIGENAFWSLDEAKDNISRKLFMKIQSLLAEIGELEDKMEEIEKLEAEK